MEDSADGGAGVTINHTLESLTITKVEVIYVLSTLTISNEKGRQFLGDESPYSRAGRICVCCCGVNVSGFGVWDGDGGSDNGGLSSRNGNTFCTSSQPWSRRKGESSLSGCEESSDNDGSAEVHDDNERLY